MPTKEFGRIPEHKYQFSRIIYSGFATVYLKSWRNKEAVILFNGRPTDNKK